MFGLHTVPLVPLPLHHLGTQSHPHTTRKSLARVRGGYCSESQLLGATTSASTGQPLSQGEKGAAGRRPSWTRDRREKGGSHRGAECQLPATSEGHLMQLSPLTLPSRWALQENNFQIASIKQKGNS